MQTSWRISFTEPIRKDDKDQQERRDDPDQRSDGQESNRDKSCWDDDEESEEFERLCGDCWEERRGGVAKEDDESDGEGTEFEGEHDVDERSRFWTKGADEHFGVRVRRSASHDFGENLGGV